MKTAQLIDATVKYAVDRIRKTKYGDKIKLVATRNDNQTDIELWDKPEAPIHYLAKGQPIRLLWDGERYTLIGVPESNGHQERETPSVSQPDNQTDIAEMIAIAQGLRRELREWSDLAIANLAQSIFKYRRDIRR
jgi:hypothetical protein